MSGCRALLLRTAERIADYRETVSESRVFPDAEVDDVRAALGVLRDTPTPAAGG